LAESGNLFDSQNCTWGTFGNILCCVTCHKPTVLPHPKNQQVCMKSPRAFNYATDFVSTDQFRIEHNACSLGLLPGFSLECAVPYPLFFGPIPSWYRAYREGVVAGDRLKDVTTLSSARSAFAKSMDARRALAASDDSS